jgi:hypothetical protein
MNRRAAGALVALAALVLLVALALRLGGGGEPAPEPDGPELDPAAASGTGLDEPERIRRTATLWLPGRAGRIAPLAVDVESAPERGARIDALLGALLAARPDEAVAAPLFPEPAPTFVTLVGADGVLYVDLHGRDGVEPPGAGSTLELQRVYSIVHTLLRNESSLAGVVLLWNGVQRASLSGHVDTTRPLALRPELEER